MTDTSLRLGLPYLKPAQAQKHVTHNEALERLDLLVQLVLVATAAETPPGSPSEGEAWALGTAPTGAWAGQAPGTIAAFQGGGWVFVAPQRGWQAWDRAEARAVVFTGGAWIPAGGGTGGALATLGINATADTTNRLAVSAPATLFSHEAGDHRLILNKAAPADTGSMLYQSGWSGRAEIGLAGSDALSIKVSPDGAAWTEALRLEPDTGRASGAAVQAAPTDATAGRLMAVGAFGLGTPPGDSAPVVTLAAATVPGLYAFAATDPGAPSAHAGTVLVQRQGKNHLRQTARRSASWDAAERYSTDGGASWSPWRSVYTAANAVGTVSQAAGVPTGALVETGTTANGRYTRLADGTQICTGRVTVPDVSAADGAGYQSSIAVAWSFPAPFTAPPALSGSIPGGGGIWTSFFTSSGTSAAIRAHAFNARGGTRDIDLMAVGRWF